MTQKVLILADNRAGNVNQLLGIAQALNIPAERIDINYGKLISLPNILRGISLIGLDKESQEKVKAIKEAPTYILTAGRRSFPVALWIKKHFSQTPKVIQLMNPGDFGFKKADLIIIPKHDNFHKKADNVLRINGAPHRITAQRLADERNYWEERFSQYPHERLALLVGGATKDKPFTLEMAKTLLENIKALQPKSVLVTSSRRTPQEIISFLEKELSALYPLFFYKYGDKQENPYFGLIACADMIMVTGDSISMCSECCASQAPVFIFAPDSMMSEKHKRFHQVLYKEGYALPAGNAKKAVIGGFNPADEIATYILNMTTKEK